MRWRFILFFVSVTALPSCTTDLPEGCAEFQDVPCRLRWEMHTRDLLSEMFADDSLLIQKIKIVIVPNVLPGASSYVESGTITINYGLIKMVDRGVEYAFVVGHEFGHLKLRHVPTAEVHWNGDRENENFALLDEQEASADELAVEALKRRKYSPCLILGFFEKITVLGGYRDDPEDPYSVLMFKRGALLEESCRSYKEKGV